MKRWLHILTGAVAILAVLLVLVWTLVQALRDAGKDDANRVVLVAYFAANRPVKAGAKVSLFGKEIGEVVGVDYFHRSSRLKVTTAAGTRTRQLRRATANDLKVVLAPERGKLLIRSGAVILDSLAVRHPDKLNRSVWALQPGEPLVFKEERISLSLSPPDRGFTEVVMEIDTAAVIGSVSGNGTAAAITAGRLLTADSRAQITSTFGLTEPAVTLSPGKTARPLLDPVVLRKRAERLRPVLQALAVDSSAVEVGVVEWFDAEVGDQVLAFLLSDPDEPVVARSRLVASLQDVLAALRNVDSLSGHLATLLDPAPALERGDPPRNYVAQTLANLSQLSEGLAEKDEGTDEVKLVGTLNRTVGQVDSTLQVVERLVSALASQNPGEQQVGLARQLSAGLQTLNRSLRGINELLALNQASITGALAKLEKLLRNVSEVAEVNIKTD